MQQDVQNQPGEQVDLLQGSGQAARGSAREMDEASEASIDENVWLGIQEKPDEEIVSELDALATKIEALIARCEQLESLNQDLTQQIARERAARARLVDVQKEAQKRVDTLIQRLQDLEDEA